MLAQEPVTWDTVKRLFTGADIAYMKMQGWVLDDAQSVAQNFDVLIGEIRSGKMPPKPFKPWSQEMKATFKAWADGGFVVSQDPTAELKQFIAMSEFLTGFDDLHKNPDLAEKYLQRLRDRPEVDQDGVDQGGVNKDDLSALIASFDSLNTAGFEEQLEKTKCEKVAKSVILLWYTAAFIHLSNGFPAGNDSTGKFGRPPHDDNRYTSGLVWRACQAHPMGFSAEGYRGADGQYSLAGKPYWEFAPEDDGTNTGLGPESFTP